MGSTDAPASGSALVDNVTVSGWAFANAAVSRVEVLVDGLIDGAAAYGLPRLDVAVTFPHAPANIGFSYSLDTTRYAHGPHTLNVGATDGTGNVSVFSDVGVTVAN
jgi:large repetitive protein